MRKVIAGLEQAGHICQIHDGRWLFKCVLAAKPHQEHVRDINEFVWRFCVNYQPLNSVTRIIALNHKMSRHCTAVPPAALPSLSMATSAMDPNRGASAPYESNVGGRRQGSRLLRLIPLFGAPKWHPSKNWEMGGVQGLGGRHSTVIHDNQPNNGVGSGWGMGEETRPGGTCERGRLPVV